MFWINNDNYEKLITIFLLCRSHQYTPGEQMLDFITDVTTAREYLDLYLESKRNKLNPFTGKVNICVGWSVDTGGVFGSLRSQQVIPVDWRAGSMPVHAIQ